jgi:hypothetical protein
VDKVGNDGMAVVSRMEEGERMKKLWLMVANWFDGSFDSETYFNSMANF